jgi:hypothetical protein
MLWTAGGCSALDHRRKFGLTRLRHSNRSNGGAGRGLRFFQVIQSDGRADRGLLAKVPLYAEVNRQNHGDNGCGAQHQNRKENFNYHRKSGYQNEGRLGSIFGSRSSQSYRDVA